MALKKRCRSVARDCNKSRARTSKKHEQVQHQTFNEYLVSCSASGGLECVNALQPDGQCNYDYKVRYLCPCDEPEPEPCHYNGSEYADGQTSLLGAYCTAKFNGVCAGGVSAGDFCVSTGQCSARCDDGTWVPT